MPENSAEVKKQAVAEYGAKIIYCAPTDRDRQQNADDIIAETGATFIHPFNDPHVIAGQRLEKANRFGWWCRLFGVKLDDEMAGFKEYITAYTETPDAFKKEGEKARGSAVPMPVRVAWLLMDRMTEEEAWNCPMTRAMAYFTSESECKGQDFVLEKDAIRLKVI